MDSLTRWSIGLGAGAFLGMGLLGVYNEVTSEARSASFGYAVDQLVPDYSKLDVKIEFDSFVLDEYVELADLLQEAEAERFIDCGGYLNPAHVCYINATIEGALDLKGAKADAIRESYALTVGEYRSPYEEILTTADSVLVDTGAGPRPVTYEGGGTFTLGFLDKNSLSSRIESWQFVAATVPVWALWFAAAAISAAAAVLITAAFRPAPEEQIESVGTEYFDEMLEP